MKEGKSLASLDWSQCPAVESIPGKVSGAWVFKGTRMPVATVFGVCRGERAIGTLTPQELEELCVWLDRRGHF